MRLDRKILLAAVAALVLTGAAGCNNSSSTAPTSTPASGPAANVPEGALVPASELAVTGPFGDKVLGAADAPVTIIEYASMTCTHCQRFATTVYPELKAKYIDTGKVRFIFREYPLDPLAAVGIMIARCAPEEQFFPMVELLFEHQAEWAFVQNPLKALFDLVKQTGFTQESFDACWKNQKNLDAVQFVRDRAAEKFGVNGTPTFFINGIKKNGEQELAAIEKAIAPFLK